MDIIQELKNFLSFLKEDTWPSWIVALALVIAFIKAIFFPALSIITGAPLPLVVVESCSMYHPAPFENWWTDNSAWYKTNNISKETFARFPFKNGINKGDIIVVWGHDSYNLGDIIIFNSRTRYPVIHRIISTEPLSTKGDNNPDRFSIEENIAGNTLMGKAVGRIPYLGWVKLIFFDFLKPGSARGFCR